MCQTRKQFVVLIFCLIFYLELGFASNVDVRKFVRIRPSKSGSSKTYHFGKQVELKSSSGNVVLYVGAPSANNPSDGSGAVYTCAINVPSEDKSEQTCDATMSFKNNGALGLSMGLDEPKQNLIVCGNQYTFKCGKTPFMVGSCYERNLLGSTNNLLNTPCQSSCIYAFIADMVFALDESGSINADDFKTQLNWVTQVLTIFENNINDGDVRAGVVVFNRNTRYPIPLKRYSFSALKLLIPNISRNGGGTNIEAAIKRSHTALNDDGRPNVSHQMIVLTDGNSGGDIFSAAESARNAGIVTFAVGVGSGVISNTLLDVAGDLSRVFTASDFNSLNLVTDRLTEEIQNSAETVLEGQSTNTTNELTQCQAGSSSHTSKTGSVHIGAVGVSDRSGSIIDFYGSTSGNTISSNFSSYLDEMELKNLISPTNFSDFKESYLGYSVTTGRFADNETEQVAAGAPRYKSKGAVFIYNATLPKNESSSGALFPNKDPKMWQLGAYFGHSVCSVDVNKDSLDDLLVSSPLFAKDLSSYDQGRVFLFVNNRTHPGIIGWASGTYQPQVLVGSNAIGARFGMSVVVGGDIDRNGYDDVIIGAPGEEASSSGSGAVYVYFVTPDGLSELNKQRILGKKVASNLLGFGGGLLRGTGNNNDIDENQYPEVVVSAPSSDDVVVLFSRPSVVVTAKIVTNSSKIDVVKCLSEVNETCTSFTFCVSAQHTTSESTNSFDMTLDIELDSSIQDNDNKRLEFHGEFVSTKSLTHQVTATETCLAYPLTLKTKAFADDLIHGSFDLPLSVVVQYDFTEAHKNKTLSGVFSVLQHRSASAKWDFLTGCSGENESCFYDLEISAKALFPQPIVSSENSSQPYLFGQTPGILELNVTLSNVGQDYVLFAGMNVSSGPLVLNQNLISLRAGSGEPIVSLRIFNYHLTSRTIRLFISLSLDISINYVINLSKVSLRVIGNCSTRSPTSSSQGIDELSFAVSKPLALNGYILPQQSCNFILRYPLHVLTDSAVISNITIKGNVYSRAGQGFGRDINPENNKFVVSRPVRYTANLELSQTINPTDTIYFNHTTDSPFVSSLQDDVLGGKDTNVFHEYRIDHVGYQILPKALMTFTWPSALSATKIFPLLYLVDFMCTPAIACQCDVSGKLNNLNISETEQLGSSVALSFPPPGRVQLREITDCSDVHCDVIECLVTQLNPFVSVTVKANFKVWIPTLSQENIRTELSSYLKVDTSESPLSRPRNVYMITASTTVSTQEDASPVEDNLPIVLGVVGGILVLIGLIMPILYKTGFFKSKYAEKLNDAKEQKEETDATPPDNLKVESEFKEEN